MSFCSACGKELPPDARFCPGCGKRVQGTAEDKQEPVNDAVGSSASRDWFTFKQLISKPSRLLGLIGIVAALVSVFVPWANVPVSGMLGQLGDLAELGAGTTTMAGHTTWGWLIMLGLIISLIALWKRRTGVIVGTIGALIAIYALACAVSVLAVGGSPSFGIVLALAGGGLMTYSEFIDRRS